MSGEDRAGPRQMAVRVGATAGLVLVLAGMASHPLPGSIDSLLRGLMFGIPGGLVAALASFVVLRARERNREGARGGERR